MGACLSKKKQSLPSSLNVSLSAPNKKFLDSDTPLKLDLPQVQFKGKLAVDEDKKKQVAEEEEESSVKKEIFVIKHRKSHDRERLSVSKDGEEEKEEEHHKVLEKNCNSNNNVVVRTSSCTKEEVDAILIQCGRLSRSNSSGTIAAKAASSGRKYAGSKRSYDLDQEQHDFSAASSADYEARKRGNGNGSYCNDDDGEEEDEDRRQHRQRHRQSGRRTHSSPSQGRRRTPSRERDREQRSGSSRERGNGSSTGRRVSRSPGRRSETTPTPNANTTTSRPGKLVSVPATVSSLTMDKSNNAVEPQTGATAVKRISVKRNAGEGPGSRAAASPRSKSPARCNARGGGGGSNENNQQQQQQPSLSRSNSRKAEHSPYRRNPLSELDPNSLVYAPTTTGNNKTSNGTGGRVQTKTREAEVKEVVTQKPNADANNNRVASSQGTNNKIVKEQTVVVEEAKAMLQTLPRSRSGRRSRDFDFNPETVVNPNPSYTALLLEDIHNFHQKNTNTNNVIAPSFSVPACVTKACSIVEAVADLNSTTSSNISCAFAEDKRIPSTTLGKKVVDAKDHPFVESEVVVSDDLMEPSLHKYVTVRRGGNGTLSGEDMDGQESSGSNSFVGGSSHNNNHWGYSTSSWEPNSADSTDRWASRSNTTREDDERSPLGFQKHVITETGLDVEEARRGFSGQRTGIGRRFNHPIVAAAST